MWILLGFLSSGFSWELSYSIRRSRSRFLWTTTRRLLPLIRKPGLQRRMDGLSFPIHPSQGNHYWSRISLCRKRPSLQNRWWQTKSYRIRRCPGLRCPSQHPLHPSRFSCSRCLKLVPLQKRSPQQLRPERKPRGVANWSKWYLLEDKKQLGTCLGRIWIYSIGPWKYLRYLLIPFLPYLDLINAFIKL